MRRYLVAVQTVHEAAIACDYLVERVGPADHVTVLTVLPPGNDPRDGGDAANVVAVRLGEVTTVESAVREGEPASTVLDEADDVDELVVVGGAPDDGVLGGTTRAVVAGAGIPVVVLPAPSV